jgi:hypothetical protein
MRVATADLRALLYWRAFSARRTRATAFCFATAARATDRAGSVWRPEDVGRRAMWGRVHVPRLLRGRPPRRSRRPPLQLTADEGRAAHGRHRPQAGPPGGGRERQGAHGAGEGGHGGVRRRGLAEPPPTARTLRGGPARPNHDLPPHPARAGTHWGRPARRPRAACRPALHLRRVRAPRGRLRPRGRHPTGRRGRRRGGRHGRVHGAALGDGRPGGEGGRSGKEGAVVAAPPPPRCAIALLRRPVGGRAARGARCATATAIDG